MSWQALVMWGVVAVIGLPAATRNATALALAVAWLVPEILYQYTGNNLPLRIYFMADVAVITCVYAKAIVRSGTRTYPIISTHFRSFIFDLTIWDRWIVAIFLAGAWPLYILAIDPWWKWMILWGLCIAQFCLAGCEPLLARLKSRPMARRKSKFDIGGDSSGGSLFQGFVLPEVNPFSVRIDRRMPPLCFMRPMDSVHAGCIVLRQAAIPQVSRGIHVPEIVDTVVCWISVNVVDLFFRPSTIMDSPSHSMSAHALGANENRMMPGFVNTPWRSSREPSVPRIAYSQIWKHALWSFTPVKLPGLWLVTKKLTQLFRGGYRMLSHGAAPSRGGQGRAAVPPVVPARRNFTNVKLVSQRRNADAASQTKPSLGRANLLVDAKAGEYG